MAFQEQISLRDISWFKTGGVSEYYTACHSLASLIAAVKEAKKRQCPFLVIGESSNLLMSDSGFPGVVIQNRSQGVVFLHDRSQVIVEAGVPLSSLVTRSIALGYSGLEFLAGVPGTVGGALYTNASAFGSAFGDYVRQATLLFPDELKRSDGIRQVDRKWFAFDYATTTLKQLQPKNQQKPVILSVTLQLSKMNTATSLARVNHYLKIRHINDPHDDVLALRVYDNLFLHGTRIPSEGLMERQVNLPPAYFVHRRQVRQWRQGQISIYQPNPNYITNDGLGTSRDAAAVLVKIEELAKGEDVALTPVIEFVGLWE